MNGVPKIEIVILYACACVHGKTKDLRPCHAVPYVCVCPYTPDVVYTIEMRTENGFY